MRALYIWLLISACSLVAMDAEESGERRTLLEQPKPMQMEWRNRFSEELRKVNEVLAKELPEQRKAYVLANAVKSTGQGCCGACLCCGAITALPISPPAAAGLACSSLLCWTNALRDAFYAERLCETDSKDSCDRTCAHCGGNIMCCIMPERSTIVTLKKEVKRLQTIIDENGLQNSEQ